MNASVMEYLAGSRGPRRRQFLWVCCLATVAIAAVDWKLKPNVSLGYLYLLPLVVAAPLISHLQTLALAAGFAVLREAFSPTAWDADALPRLVLMFLAFVGVGLFVSELTRNHQMAVEHAQEMEREVRLRQDVEAELRVLVESSPAAIVTTDASGRLLMANTAARRMLEIPQDGPLDYQATSFVPALQWVLDGIHGRRFFRTSLEGLGRTAAGTTFLAHVWFSTYDGAHGRRLAAIILDATEELRDRETGGLSALVATSRAVFGAVSHEIRNLAAAASLSHANLARLGSLAEDPDFRALGTLVQGLERIASSGLRLSSEGTGGSVSLGDVLDELRVILEPLVRETEAELRWQVPEAMPRVKGDHHGLLQVFLNLTQNGLREVTRSPGRGWVGVVASTEDGRVQVRLTDSGGGVEVPESLFRPFQEAADATGLGLFVSRTIARSFGGDLRWERREGQDAFVVELVPAQT